MRIAEPSVEFERMETVSVAEFCSRRRYAPVLQHDLVLMEGKQCNFLLKIEWEKLEKLSEMNLRNSMSKIRALP